MARAQSKESIYAPIYRLLRYRVIAILSYILFEAHFLLFASFAQFSAVNLICLPSLYELVVLFCQKNYRTKLRKKTLVQRQLFLFSLY